MTTNADAEVKTTQADSEKLGRSSESINALIDKAMQLYDNDRQHVQAARYFLQGLRAYKSTQMRMFLVERTTEHTPYGTFAGTFEEHLLRFAGQAHARDSFKERLRGVSRRFSHIAA